MITLLISIRAIKLRDARRAQRWEEKKMGGEKRGEHRHVMRSGSRAGILRKEGWKNTGAKTGISSHTSHGSV